jgi:MraZ protein
VSRQVERFHGSFEYSLDPKSRIILPARLRTGFEAKKAFLSCYVDRCLAVWAPDAFNHYLERAEAMEAMGSEGRDLSRILSAFSGEVEIDAQWRLTIPANLRAYAGLEPERPVMVVGALNHIELWQTELWMERATPTLESLANGTSPLFSAPLTAAGLVPQPAGNPA